jgi:pyruvate formate lyase activating enzyme
MEIKGLIETSFLDWPGKVCAVLFLPSCNLRCPFCHNPDLVLHPDRLDTIPWAFVEKRLSSLRSWLDGVCVTGGEPTIHADLPELLRRIRGLGLSVKLDSNGTRPEVLESLVDQGLMDYLAMDVKGPLDEGEYGRCAGVPVSLAAIRRSMALIRSGRVQGEFRTTVVPDWHTPTVLARMADELRPFPRWTHQAFNPARTLDPAFQAH